MYPPECALCLWIKDSWCHHSLNSFLETHEAVHLLAGQRQTGFSFMGQGLHLSWANLCHPITSHTAPWNKSLFQLGYIFPSTQHSALSKFSCAFSMPKSLLAHWHQVCASPCQYKFHYSFPYICFLSILAGMYFIVALELLAVYVFLG